MGASVGYNHTPQATAIYGIQGSQPPQVLSSPQGLSVQGTMSIGQATSGKSPAVALSNINSLTQDLRYLQLMLFNNTGQAITAASLSGSIQLAGLTQTLTFPFYTELGSLTLNVAARSIATFLCPLPYPFPLSSFVVNVTFGARASGTVGYFLLLSGPGTPGHATHLIPASGALNPVGSPGSQSILSPLGEGLSYWIYAAKLTNEGSSGVTAQLGYYPYSAEAQSVVPVENFDEAYLAAGGGGYNGRYSHPFKIPANNGVTFTEAVGGSNVHLTIEYLIAP